MLRYILQIDKELDENKKGQISKNMSLSRVVESERIELSSKQVTKGFSTRLFFSWVFDYKLVKDNPLITYLL